ncbi:hypothetical protein BGZ73_006018 [Actinomortierella ambigua]|nr:hypothetical protein BGZ73_006018 [Actinomortierella ambigua]
MTTDKHDTGAPPPELHIGQRIEQNTFRGTVKYIGPVVNTKGEWAGVEWDEVSRGKHSGSHEGQQYFECLFPGTGSFTRITNKIETGTDFLGEVKDRYVGDERTLAKLKEQEEGLYLEGSNIKIELFDFERVREKQRNLSELTSLSLNGSQLARAGDSEEIKATCPKVDDLDVSTTMIPSWDTLAQICIGLPKLEILRANRNRYVPLTSTPMFGNAFQNVRVLTLNRTFMTWNDLTHLEPSLPNLEVLQFGYNNLKTFDSSDDTLSGDNEEEQQQRRTLCKLAPTRFARLRDLHLEGNGMHDWRQIRRLSALPSLVSLDLSENAFEAIEVPEEGDGVAEENSYFSRLEVLRMPDNPLKQWRSIDQLAKHHPALKTLWLTSPDPIPKQTVTVEELGPEAAQAHANAVTKSLDISARTSIIARCPNLVMLNGNEISAKERLSSELYYLNHVGMAMVGLDKEVVQRYHPRYDALCEIHGAPDTSEETRKAQSEVLADRLMNMKIHVRETEDGPTKVTLERKVLETMTVRSLKNLVQKLAKLPALRQQLCFWVPSPIKADAMVKVVLADDLRMLSYYDVKDGLEIVAFDKTKS